MFDKISIGDNMKEIYLLRHSEGLKKIEQVINSDSLQIINEKNLEQNIRNEIAKEIKPNKPK